MSKIEYADREIKLTLANLSKLFTPKMKLTLVARDPENDNCVMIHTDDKLEEVSRVVAVYGQREKMMTVSKT